MGSRKVLYPWRLADWIEEICHLFSQLNCNFIHVLHGVNEAADELAREMSAI